MTKTELYAFVTSLLDGNPLESTLFDTFLNIAQMRRENQRPWMILRTEDTSQTVSPGNTFETIKDLPTDFRKWYTRFPIVLADSSGNAQQFLRETPLSMKLANRTDITKFYCDYSAGELFICGSPAQALTVHQYYIRKTYLVSANNANEWTFPTEYHSILGFDIAVMFKLGVDYDVINNAQGNANAAQAAMIFEQMSEWDSDLQNSSIQGQDYGTYGGWRGTATGGTLPPDIM